MNQPSGTALDALAHAFNGRTFSLRQANRSLVLVRRIVTDIVDQYTKLLELQEILEMHQRDGDVGELALIKAASGEAVERLQGYLRELDEVGVKFRDFARGLVDFPACVGGQDVHYCWQLGEDSIQYWHAPGEGFAGRRHVCELADLPATPAAQSV